MRSASPYDIPVATYRLQLHAGFTFADATAVVPYLARLGISHVYASPFLKARAGSAHGYDIVDHNRLNPELGSRESFEQLGAALDAHGMGLILDFVPNHMGVGKADNPWWLDMLEWGRVSPYSRFFDVDWNPPRRALQGKVLIPVLGQSYGAALKSGEVVLRFDPQEGSLSFWYFEHRLPLTPSDYAEVLAPILPALGERVAGPLARLRVAVDTGADATVLRAAGDAVKAALVAVACAADDRALIERTVGAWPGPRDDPESQARFHAVLQRQAYRLAYWRTAADEINYRRFFDIGDLAGLRIEVDDVFKAAHGLVGELVASGALHGLRIDHVDGLADPRRYCRMLNACLAAWAPRCADGRRRPLYVLVEKILASHERLRRGWPVAGTTGYDYLAMVNGLFVDPAGMARLERHWQRFTGRSFALDDELHRCKRLVIEHILASELTLLTNLLVEIGEADWQSRDFTRHRLREALSEIVAAFPVYRTYVTARDIAAADRRDIAWAVGQARKRWTGTDVEIFDFVRSLLTLEIAMESPDHFRLSRELILRFLARFQQYTGAVTAKAVEDTLFYRYVPLVSINEVGGDPRSPATSIEALHRNGVERARDWPHAMLASETHDTKRAEDVRARLDVLSELADEWGRRAARWQLLNRAKRGEVDGAAAPTLNDEYLLYQTIVGSWPTERADIRTASARLGRYVERLKTYTVKACREAKVMTSWLVPNQAYESAVLSFIDRIFAYPERSPFLQSVARFASRLAPLGAINSLAQLVLKATFPGVPDFYQGSELWDLSLVDPDNRRPVDFAHRITVLKETATLSLAAAKQRWRDGGLKLRLTRDLLALRNSMPALFRSGSYHGLGVEGPSQDHLVAYARRSSEAEVIVVVPRLVARRLDEERGSLWPGGALFVGTAITGVTPGAWTELFSGATLVAAEGRLDAASVLATLPVAVLTAGV